MKVSLCLIVKDEEAVLERCLNSMQFYDELVIVDTGSTDRTKEIIEKFGAITADFEWVDDFAAARNAAFDLASGDWIVWVDADDVLMPGDDIKFREDLERHHHKGEVAINYPYIYSHESGGTGEIPEFKYHRLRAVRASIPHIWKGRVHEYIDVGDAPQAQSQAVEFHHYRGEGKGTQNTARNLRILRKVVEEASEEERPRYLFYLGKECMYNGLWDDAEKAFLEYIPISNWVPEKHRAMYELAVCYHRKGDIENAKRYCFEAILIEPEYSDPYVLLGQIAYNAERWKEVLRWMICTQFLTKPKVQFFDYIPNMTYVPFDYMAMAYWHMGDYEQGLNCINECLKFRPKDRRYIANKYEFLKQLELQQVDQEG